MNYLILFSAVSAIITATGESIAGEEETLTCSVSVQNSTPTIKWRGPDRDILINGSGIIVGDRVTSGNITNTTLHFTPLLTSHGGTYSCHASTVNVVTMRRETVALSQAVTVQSEYNCIPLMQTLKE